jgi:hypothetical protein
VDHAKRIHENIRYITVPNELTDIIAERARNEPQFFITKSARVTQEKSAVISNDEDSDGSPSVSGVESDS